MTTDTGTITFTRLSDVEGSMSRVFDAPRELVYTVLTDPEQIPLWWGPRSVTTIVEQMDVKPGGTYRYIQRDDQGNEYAFRGEYREVVPPERTVATFEFEPMPGHVVVDTTTLEDLGGKTRVTVTSLYQSKEDFDGMIASGAEAGARESWDRLAELLASQQ